MEKLAAAKINVVSMQAICSGEGRFGGILWVGAADVRKAAKALGIASKPQPAVPPAAGTPPVPEIPTP